MTTENKIDTVMIGKHPITWVEVVRVARHKEKVELSEATWGKIQNSREFVEKVTEGDELHYGINSGLGALCNVRLNKDELTDLSFHTLMSHACGVGDSLSNEQVRAIMCAAIVNYSHGYSGVSVAVVKALISFLNEEISPVVPAKGSVGYLTHMAHIGLSLIGTGKVDFRGKKMAASEAISLIGMKPLKLGAKDGLSLVNGTPSMTGLASLCLEDIYDIALWSDIASSMSFEALNGQVTAIGKPLIGLKAHPGMQQTANNLQIMLRDSVHLELAQGQHLQDALSLRAIPHVHGACRDQLIHAEQQINRELNSVSDNPVIFKEGDVFSVLSQAHAHGESVAMACDILAIAICEWSSISERRIHRLVNPGTNKLPDFLTLNSGVKSGMMIAQYTAASLASDNKRLASPSVIDNYVTSGFQEDHLSFGESSALKLKDAIDNSFYIISIEVTMAAQAFDLISDKQFGEGTNQAWLQFREHVKHYDEERPLNRDIEAAFNALKGGFLLKSIKEALNNSLA